MLLNCTKKVALIYGGPSGEYEVSCRSAHYVWKMLKESYEVILIGINKKGQWFWQNTHAILGDTLGVEEGRPVRISPTEGFFYEDKKLAIDIIFPITHGTYGEDGRLQALLDFTRIPYAGCSFLSSAICMDKSLVKMIWERENIPTLPFSIISSHEMTSLTDDELKSRFEYITSYPLIVKPSSGGSSLGISKVNSFLQLREALANCFKWDKKAILEPFGKFREIECAVTGSNSLGNIEIYPLGEIEYGNCEFYDYQAKYENDTLILQVPASISLKVEEEIKKIALRAYTSAGCEGFARVDFFLTEDNQIFVNEINTLPGFTKVSLFPKMCLSKGLSLKDLGVVLVEEAVERFKNLS